MREHRPNSIEEVVVPPQPELRYEAVSERSKAALLRSLAHDGPIAFEAKTGEVVGGIRYMPAGRASSFQVRFETEGRARVIDAWRTGQLAGLVGTDVLPQIEG